MLEEQMIFFHLTENFKAAHSLIFLSWKMSDFTVYCLSHLPRGRDAGRAPAGNSPTKESRRLMSQSKIFIDEFVKTKLQLKQTKTKSKTFLALESAQWLAVCGQRLACRPQLFLLSLCQHWPSHRPFNSSGYKGSILVHQAFSNCGTQTTGGPAVPPSGPQVNENWVGKLWFFIFLKRKILMNKLKKTSSQGLTKVSLNKPHPSKKIKKNIIKI